VSDRPMAAAVAFRHMVAMAAAECRHMVAAADRQAVPAASKKMCKNEAFFSYLTFNLKIYNDHPLVCQVSFVIAYT
jgi:hypothetical protein